jgi:hypothetical protein
MESHITITMPIPIAVFAVFLGIGIAALVYWVYKFVASMITGG